MIRKWGTTLIAGFALGVLALGPAAAEYPEKPINVVIPAGPGSATDTNARLVLNAIAEKQSLGQPAVVINVNGGPIAATRVKDAAPDGYEILVYHIGLMGTKAVGKLDFGVEAFEPIAQTGSTNFIVVVAEEGPYADFQALVDAARAAPGEINEANSIGGASHIATLQLAAAAEFQPRVVHVGDGPTRLQSVLGGHSAYTVVSPQEYKGFSGTGIKAVAVMGPERSPDLPDVPSTAELGYPTEISVDTWWFAPKDTPAEVVDKLAGAIEEAMNDEALQDSYRKQGVAPTFLRGEELAKRLATVDALVAPMGAALGGN
ncbi:tripartite tricarboxylate transporter substrate binding protein [Chelativorans sp. J32]|uniref:Bug family tripartite tricarboxylate transporter substrate binding protein n=1 Tax=Chelativorans sp. J32 TaxID=935840 RepID=UPI00047F9328|nr:tripartite tricarboxylate transporter substrate binding protein [Chelativorans sp. J32]